MSSITTNIREMPIRELKEFDGSPSNLVSENVANGRWNKVTFDPLRVEPAALQLLAIREVTPAQTPPKYEIVGFAIPPALRKEVEEAFKKSQKKPKKAAPKKVKKPKKKVTFVKGTKKSKS